MRDSRLYETAKPQEAVTVKGQGKKVAPATGIFYVDDDSVIRACLKSLLRKIADFQIVGEAADGDAAVEGILAARPSVALVDIGLPKMNGIEVARRVKASLPDVRVLMLTSSEAENDIFDSLDAGADGYVLKGDFSSNLEVAIRSVRVGAVWLDPGIARFVLKASHRPVHGQAAQPEALSKEEETLLGKVADSNCQDGVCLVDPSFVKKLRRFRTAEF
ncbi:MAG TPA: response regulator transcription factor [Candidatus Obscuribacterales bacterium]